MFKKSRSDYPLGVLAVYDNGGRTADRYKVVFTPHRCDGELAFPTLSMSARPSHPQGVGTMGEYRQRPTRGRGDRVIAMSDLPEDCLHCVDSYLGGREIECPRCGGLVPELVSSGPHAGERCRICVSH